MPLRPPAGFVSSFYDPLKNPNAPTVGTASAGDQSASVTFTAPSNVGGSAITNYYAVSNPGQITASSVTSPVTVTGLTNGTSYTFTVWALNSFGPSAYSAASGSVTPSPPYIEDVFSTWLYTGTASTQTITNGIDLSTKGGLVWTKSRSAAIAHSFFDTLRGSTKRLNSATTAAEATDVNSLTSFNSSGFDLGSASVSNGSGNTYASWTFRKQPKFFDVVTYTGNGTRGTTISHNLGSVPGCIIIKKTSATENWAVYHRSLGNTQSLALNLTNAAGASFWNDTTPTSTVFTVGNEGQVNDPGQTYVAYLFAHDAGGFGLTGTDNVISCGSYTGTGAAGNAITLGYEPQWLLIKRTDSTSDWAMFNNMMGMTLTDDTYLWANLASVENTYNVLAPTATGFVFQDPYLNASGGTYIYIAIRRGPMKTPTTGTSVFDDLSRSGTGTVGSETVVGFPVDMVLNKRSSEAATWVQLDRLRGNPRVLFPSSTDAEFNLVDAGLPSTNGFTGPNQNSYYWPAGGSNYNGSGSSYASYFFRRAPGFFDVVCYSGSSSNTTQTHNLGVVPEMIIVKSRNNSRGWPVYTSPTGAGNFLFLNSTDESAGASTYWNNTTPTASVFSLGTAANTNNSGDNYVAYLFATLAGVSKVGSYTGTGNTLQINCGFTGGARFVLIKRTDVAGAWYVWDSARGIVSGNDPYLLLNSTAAEVTNTDWVDAHSPGFELSNAAGNNVNINGGTFVFLAIA